MKKYLKNLVKQPSTYKGVALLAASAAAAVGHPELVTASVSETGVSFGGLIGTFVPVALGLWETLRNEFK
ncbi:hypothetical protein [Vibrio atypicus]|uniref:hypothetical protein n=1 Tax=Vibrio atypicus TaxID=558271 RepID=UPI00135B4743|nr:hypothetical protein [Vibrio atypicus]